MSYHPHNSNINRETLDSFVSATLSGNLSEIPGVGPNAERILNANDIDTSYQLLGKYMSFKGEGVDIVDHHDQFHEWLVEIGIPSGFWSTCIVKAVACKMDDRFPGLYSEDETYDNNVCDGW